MSDGAIAVIVEGDPPATRPWSRLRTRAGRVVAAVTVWQAALALVIVAYVWYFTWISLQVHHGLGTSAYDVGLYDQGVWLMSRFEAPYVTLMGRNLMGDHTSFILVLLVPFYWVWPSTGVLFFFQSLAIGMGALPVFLYARKHLRSEAIAFVLAGGYLLHPAVGWTNRENFHPDSFLGVFVGMALYAALERKWRMYLVFVVLSLLVKEDASLVIVPLGVWVAIKRDRRIGLLTVAGSLFFMVFAMYVVMRSLIGVPTRNGWRIPFGGPSGVIRETLERPGNVIDHFRSDGRPFYLWQMTFPFAWLFARAPSVALISAVVLTTNMLSTFWYQYQIEYHYSLVAVPALSIGTVYALGFVRNRWRRWAVTGVAVTTVWSCVMWGAVPIGALLMPWSDDPVGRDVSAYWAPDHPVAVAARDIMSDIPDDAVVSAFHALTAHLAHRRQIYQFPTPFRAVLYGPNLDLEQARARLPAADDVEYVVLQKGIPADQQADWEPIADEFELVRSNDYWALYRRK